jgi:hypothetical protein
VKIGRILPKILDPSKSLQCSSLDEGHDVLALPSGAARDWDSLTKAVML